MRLNVLFGLAAVSAVVALGPPVAAAQDTEAPSSRPLPSPGAPQPPLTAPRDGPGTGVGAAPAPDRNAADAAVRAQCTADRARFCRESSGVGALACLSGNFAELTPDCQSAVTALKEARTARGGG